MKRFKNILITLSPYRGALWLAVFMLTAWWAFVGKDYSFIRIEGNSMDPTIEDNEWLVIEKDEKGWKPRRFDIIVFKDEGLFDQMCKRVIGVAGDHIKFGSGMIYLNRKELLDEIDAGFRTTKYWDGKRWGGPYFILETELVVPKGYVWVIGDNRENSWYGLVLLEDIAGKVVI